MTRRQLVVATATALTGVGGGLAWPMHYVGRLYPGTTLLNLNLGGLAPAEAADRIEEWLAPFLDHPMMFRFGERTWTPSAADLGMRIDMEATLKRALHHGREKGLVQRYATLLRQGNDRNGIPVVVEVNTDTLQTYFDRLAGEIDRGSRSAQLVVTGTEVEIEPERMGRHIDHASMHDAVLGAAATLTPTEIRVVTEVVEPAITTSQLMAAQTVAATILGDAVTIERDDQRWIVTPDQLAEALVLPDDLERSLPTVDHSILETFLSPISEEVDAPPQDATVAWDGGLYATTKGYAGVEVDLARLSRDIATAALGAERTVTLPLNSIPPTIDAAHLDRLGIAEPLASGSSAFTGSGEARATNVAVAARHVSQTLVPPWGVFSFNDALGPITLDAGYVEGKIISGDWFASDLGGGVCQVSTTVYRAALLAGLSFEEWHPHSFRLGFYELNGWPPGMDATIYQPNSADEWELDLQFVNPTDGWILLQMTVEGDVVTATLYGTPTGYTVEIGEPILGEPIPLPKVVERPTPNLPAGEREQVQRAQEGVEVALTRNVFSDGELIAEETFVSRYEPQPAVFLVGTANET